MKKEEVEILIKLRNNDKGALGELFFLYYEPLLHFASKFVSEKDAQDLIQDCFLDLWYKRKKIKINISIKSYLFTIIKNRCYKFLIEKQNKANKFSMISLKLKQQELLFFINSENSVLEFEIQDRFEAVISQLPERCSMVFRESRFNGLSNKEIADKLQITVKAVEKHITKALKLFKNEFNDIIPFLLYLIIQNF